MLLEPEELQVVVEVAVVEQVRAFEASRVLTVASEVQVVQQAPEVLVQLREASRRVVQPVEQEQDLRELVLPRPELQ